MKKPLKILKMIAIALVVIFLVSGVLLWKRLHFDGVVLVNVNQALPQSQLEMVQKELSNWITVPVTTVAYNGDIQSAFQAERKQWDAAALLQMKELFAPAEGWNKYSIVFVEGDIFAASYNYLFTAGNPFRLRTIVGTARLLNPKDGVELNAQRITKILKRRIGIASGILGSECGPMGFSNSMQELDAKPTEYCKEDEAYLKNHGVLK